MKFAEFASFLSRLEKTSSRLKMTEILGQVFKSSSHKEIDKVCYLALGQLAPKYEALRLDLAEKLMIRVISRLVLTDERGIYLLYKEVGDLGGIIERSKIPARDGAGKNQRSKISVTEAYREFVAIAQESGEGSVERKINGMVSLLKKLDPLSLKYAVRIPVNKLRLGFSDMTILDALSWMEKGDKSLRSDLEGAFNVLADIGKIASIFKKDGLRGIKKVKSRIGIPIRAAKAERLPTAEKILEKMNGRCALEPKYDGFRVEIHFSKIKNAPPTAGLFEQGKKNVFVKIFSRNLDDITYMFPDIVAAAQKLPVKSAILDGEAIAFDQKSNKFLPFQETVQRKRKYDIVSKAKELPLKVFVFDLLYLNAKSLIPEPFSERRKKLVKLLENRTDKTIVLTEQKIVSEAKQFDTFFKQMVSEGLEGLMAKKLDTPYKAGARDFNWVKYKVGMQSELADTIDCVVMGYYRGRGKRSAFGVGAFLVGVRKGDQVLTVSKIGTGLTDEQWRELYKRCEKLKAVKEPEEYVVDKNIVPDVWCRPELVVEIEADTITKSPIHTAGLALRFPRLKRFRDDKDADQATSLQELKKLVK